MRRRIELRYAMKVVAVDAGQRVFYKYTNQHTVTVRRQITTSILQHNIKDITQRSRAEKTTFHIK